ncbi:anti-sigma factor [Sphaerisporangium siamense]|uniref:Serine/threonine-protein kinase RsbW n=1 Tax=Sphaerisporangium siamense TaxID=795645 RepID=A0A7W7GAQ6_9ACTN|nr:ATP-binding protein [Sphaerisporangium siamense]MBB4702622.1 serine/threonine-protein kinase RsbW [Sphaerisporangium siamense]GII83625.1 anti-sigma factor [Sphaerisporangium siamense]
MKVTIALRLPRDAASVSVTRQILGAELEVLGVERQIREDVQLMLTEACSNVIRHANAGDEYTVSVEVLDDKCLITVTDTGTGFDPDQVSPGRPLAEHGRGLQIMRALADDVRFMNRPRHGAIVCLEKTLRFVKDAPGRLLSTH